jgi:hypothetical protein
VQGGFFNLFKIVHPLTCHVSREPDDVTRRIARQSNMTYDMTSDMENYVTSDIYLLIELII